MLDKNEAISIRDAQHYIVNRVLENNLTYIESNFIKLAMAIYNLQQQNVLLSKSVKEVQVHKISFETFSGQNREATNKKLHQILQKNRSSSALIIIFNILKDKVTSGNLDKLSEYLSSNNLVFFKCTPITIIASLPKRLPSIV